MTTATISTTDFVYTTYIRSTPQKVWDAITNPEFARQYWGNENVSTDWKKGSQWKHVDGRTGQVRLVGQVLESNPPHKLVLSWADPADPSDVSQVTYEIEALQDAVRLNIVHGGFKAGSTMREKVSGGWPLVLSNLKTFLEGGKPFDIWALKTCK
ncbi:MAG: SRPBCC family protein [Candidatus Omnitrophica bacterium]|nr:SRPBCC family protein [Candidatus Omnitrophota bacterium]MDE2223154.1 SRPBCC family protein [Candidatus Omnitrophota bacterium]